MKAALTALAITLASPAFAQELKVEERPAEQWAQIALYDYCMQHATAETADSKCGKEYGQLVASIGQYDAEQKRREWLDRYWNGFQPSFNAPK
jgi:hypothetical protein